MNAAVKASDTFDGLFLYTVCLPGVGEVPGGIEWVGQGETAPDELPAPEDLAITMPAHSSAAPRHDRRHSRTSVLPEPPGANCPHDHDR